MAATSTAPGRRRPPRGALLSVSLASSESAEWVAECAAGATAFRAAVLARASEDARARGRRFFEIRGAAGQLLATGEVAR